MHLVAKGLHKETSWNFIFQSSRCFFWCFLLLALASSFQWGFQGWVSPTLSLTPPKKKRLFRPSSAFSGQRIWWFQQTPVVNADNKNTMIFVYNTYLEPVCPLFFENKVFSNQNRGHLGSWIYIYIHMHTYIRTHTFVNDICTYMTYTESHLCMPRRSCTG